MTQSNSEMSGFLAELAGEATQKLEVLRAQQQDRQALVQGVNAALDRTFQFFNLFTRHLNALEPDVPRVYALDGKAQFSRLKWKSGLVEYRKQSLADNALLDHVYFQARLAAPEPVAVVRRWEQFEEIRKDLLAYGLRSVEDMHEMWRNRPQKVTFQIAVEPEFLLRMRFRGDYENGSVDLECNNLDGFGGMKGKVDPELLRAGIFDELGRFLLGRSRDLPRELALTRDFSRNL
jgi:hypothetical protein